LLRVYSNAHPDMTPSEVSYPFVECGRFADEIREDPKKNGNWLFYWHFVDIGYYDQGGGPKEYPGFVQEPDSIDKAIPFIMDWLMRKGDYKKNFVYETMI
jgi:hypothetical protein